MGARDPHHIVGFSDYARRMQPNELLVSGWERVWGTNMEHAFRIARRLLNAEPGTERQVIMVTDGPAAGCSTLTCATSVRWSCATS